MNAIKSTAQEGRDSRTVTGLKLSFSKLATLQPARTPVGSRTAAAAAAQAANLEELYARACGYLSQVFEMVRRRQPFSLKTGTAIISEMGSASGGSDGLFITALHRDEPEKFAIHHSVNVAVYALHVARDLGFDPEQQVQIGLAGLLHDVGMALVPESTIYKPGPLSETELQTLKKRPILAFQILQNLGDHGAAIAETAGQICERIDGSGYPHGLTGGEIHEFAKLLGLLDLYEALVHSRPNRERLSFFEAAKYIFKSCKTQFERHYVKALLRVFTVFPLHSCVELNSGAFGRVIETHADQPMRPTLKVLMDSQRRKVLVERLIDLPAESLLHIVRSVSEKEINELLQGLSVSRSEREPDCDTVMEPVM
jgi:HD-GYP domain-containing protein (c-di-GMP phosphodiesterase class II)